MNQIPAEKRILATQNYSGSSEQNTKTLGVENL